MPELTARPDPGEARPGAAEPFDPAAVLAGRAPGRTPVAFITGIAVTAACAMVALGIDAVQSFSAGDGPAPFAIALPLALLPVPLLIAVVLWMDRLEPEPRATLAFAFGWGAGIAALAALIINTADLVYVTMPALGATTGEYVAATFGAPVIEETLKGLVLVGLLWRRRGELDGPTDGVIYAAMVGLGFAMIENVGYYINAIVTPQRGGIALLGYTFVLRGVLSPLLHPIFTSMTGLGVAFAASRRRGAPWAVLLGLLAAVLLHATWNGLSLYGRTGLVAAYLIMALVLAGLLITLTADRRRLVRLIRRYLPSYQRTGLVTPGDVEMLASLRGRGAARAWARRGGGRAAAAAMSDFQLAATELALARAKADRGVLGPGAFAAREQSLLTLMAVARRALTRRLPSGGTGLLPVAWPVSGPAVYPGETGSLPPHRGFRASRVQERECRELPQPQPSGRRRKMRKGPDSGPGHAEWNHDANGEVRERGRMARGGGGTRHGHRVRAGGDRKPGERAGFGHGHWSAGHGEDKCGGAGERQRKRPDRRAEVPGRFSRRGQGGGCPPAGRSRRADPPGRVRRGHLPVLHRPGGQGRGHADPDPAGCRGRRRPGGAGG